MRRVELARLEGRYDTGSARDEQSMLLLRMVATHAEKRRFGLAVMIEYVWRTSDANET